MGEESGQWCVLKLRRTLERCLPSPLWEPQSVIAGPPSAVSHHPFDLGWAKNLSLEQVSQEGYQGFWPRNHILRPSGLVASANIVGFFPGS